MICQHCKKIEATVFLTEIENKKKVEFRLCEDCARNHTKFSAIKLPPVEDLKSPAKNQGFIPSPAIAETAEPCSACGLTLTTFRTTLRLGCAHDYEHFKVHLVPLIERIHKSSQHTGKTPSRAVERELASRRKDELERLIHEQQRCIAEEKYERAAELRDMITELEEQTKLN